MCPVKEEGPDVELVVTVPPSVGISFVADLGARTTLGAFTELVATAKNRVVIAAPYIQGALGLHAGPLGLALLTAIKRGVRVDLISTGESLSGLELNDLKARGSGLVRTFQPRSNVDDARMLGSHAKLCFADESHAYIGSANITQKGISGQFEMGVLLHGTAARKAYKVICALIDSGYVVES